MAQFKILPNTYILSPLICFSRKRLFEEMSDLAAAITGVEARVLLTALNEREAMGATACAKGICIPHGVISELKQSVAVLALLQAEIPFNSVDSDYQGVDFALAFFLSPKDKYEERAQMLRLVSRELNNPDLANSFRRVWQDTNKLMMLMLKLDNLLFANYKPITPPKETSSTNPIVQFITEAIGGVMDDN